MLVESDPTQPVIALKSLDAFTAAADGKATKIIIPSEIQGLAGILIGTDQNRFPFGNAVVDSTAVYNINLK